MENNKEKKTFFDVILKYSISIWKILKIGVGVGVGVGWGRGYAEKGALLVLHCRINV